jgi:hypothetical protein
MYFKKDIRSILQFDNTNMASFLSTQQRRKCNMNRKMFLSLSIVMVCFLLVNIVGCAPSEDEKLITLIKESTLTGYESKTVGDATTAFLGNPKWSVQRTEDGNEYVTVTGSMTVAEKDVICALQFLVDTKNGVFQVQALEFNSVPQNQLMITALLTKMYE